MDGGHMGMGNAFGTGSLGATIYKALEVPLNVKLGKDGVSNPITTGEPLLKLFG